MELDSFVHQSTRLQIFAYLYNNGAATFSEIGKELDVTDGNLSSHLQKMEDRDAVEVEKEFVDRQPRTTYELTSEGRELFEDHIKKLSRVIHNLDDGTSVSLFDTVLDPPSDEEPI